MTTNSNNIILPSDVVEFADALKDKIRENLWWSNKLRNTVFISTPKTSKDQMSIHVTVAQNVLDAKGRPLVGMARAFEYGSGIWATRGKKAKYIIRGTEGKKLAFHWPNANVAALYGSMFSAKRKGMQTKFSGQLPDGRLTFNYVEHPGVHPRPFIKPSLAELGDAKNALALRIRNNIKRELGVVITGMNKQ